VRCRQTDAGRKRKIMIARMVSRRCVICLEPYKVRENIHRRTCGEKTCVDTHRRISHKVYRTSARGKAARKEYDRKNREKINAQSRENRKRKKLKKNISHRCKNGVCMWCPGVSLGKDCECECHTVGIPDTRYRPS